MSKGHVQHCAPDCVCWEIRRMLGIDEAEPYCCEPEDERRVRSDSVGAVSPNVAAP